MVVAEIIQFFEHMTFDTSADIMSLLVWWMMYALGAGRLYEIGWRVRG